MRNDTQILESIEQQLISMKMKLKRIEELGRWFHGVAWGCLLGGCVSVIASLILLFV